MSSSKQQTDMLEAIDSWAKHFLCDAHALVYTYPAYAGNISKSFLIAARLYRIGEFDTLQLADRIVDIERTLVQRTARYMAKNHGARND